MGIARKQGMLITRKPPFLERFGGGYFDMFVSVLDKDGNKLFHSTDRLDIMNKVDSDVLAKIAAAMVQSPTAYDAHFY